MVYSYAESKYPDKVSSLVTVSKKLQDSNHENPLFLDSNHHKLGMFAAQHGYGASHRLLGSRNTSNDHAMPMRGCDCTVDRRCDTKETKKQKHMLYAALEMDTDRLVLVSCL